VTQHVTGVIHAICDVMQCSVAEFIAKVVKIGNFGAVLNGELAEYFGDAKTFYATLTDVFINDKPFTLAHKFNSWEELFVEYASAMGVLAFVFQDDRGDYTSMRLVEAVRAAAARNPDAFQFAMIMRRGTVYYPIYDIHLDDYFKTLRVARRTFDSGMLIAKHLISIAKSTIEDNNASTLTFDEVKARCGVTGKYVNKRNLVYGVYADGAYVPVQYIADIADGIPIFTRANRRSAVNTNHNTGTYKNTGNDNGADTIDNRDKGDKGDKGDNGSDTIDNKDKKSDTGNSKHPKRTNTQNTSPIIKLSKLLSIMGNIRVTFDAAVYFDGKISYLKSMNDIYYVDEDDVSDGSTYNTSTYNASTYNASTYSTSTYNSSQTSSVADASDVKDIREIFRAIPRLDNDYDVQDVSRAIATLEPPAKDKRIDLAKHALYENYLYQLLVLEFLNYIDHERDTDKRRRIERYITNTPGKIQLSSLTEIMQNDMDTKTMKSQLSCYGDRKRLLAHIEKTHYQFDRSTIARLKTLPLAKVKEELTLICRTFTVDGEATSTAMTNVYLPCEYCKAGYCKDNKLVIPERLLLPYIDVLARDVVNPLKYYVMTSGIFADNVIDWMAFTQHVDEKITIRGEG